MLLLCVLKYNKYLEYIEYQVNAKAEHNERHRGDRELRSRWQFQYLLDEVTAPYQNLLYYCEER